MQRELAAGAAYFASVFAVGFVLGTLRTLIVGPLVGETVAVALELPIMLAASWLLSRTIVDRFAVPPHATSRLAMGGIAFAMLMVAEALLSTLLAGRTLDEHLALYARPDRILGLAGQVAFALVPLLQAARR